MEFGGTLEQWRALPIGRVEHMRGQLARRRAEWQFRLAEAVALGSGTMSGEARTALVQRLQVDALQQPRVAPGCVRPLTVTDLQELGFT